MKKFLRGLLTATALLVSTFASGAGFTIPNVADAFDPKQSQIDKVDIDILVAGYAQTGVVSGCAVTAQSTPDMTLAVASGTVAVGGSSAGVTGGNVTITTAHATLPRFDLVVVSNTGVKSVTAGTAATAPVFPAIPASSVVLAAVYVPALQAAIQNNKIVDKRVILVVGSGTPGGTNTQVQRNNAGFFAGITFLTSDGTDTTVTGAHWKTAGVTTGVITFVPQANSGTYNWNWPVTAGAAGQPLISGGSGAQGWGSVSGTSGVFLQAIGAFTTNDCLKIDANGNAADAGVTCGGGSGSPGGSDTQVQSNNAGAFGGITKVTSNGVYMSFESGNLRITGTTSGVGTITTPAAAGTWTLQLPDFSTGLGGKFWTFDGAAGVSSLRLLNVSDIPGSLTIAGDHLTGPPCSVNVGCTAADLSLTGPGWYRQSGVGAAATVAEIAPANLGATSTVGYFLKRTGASTMDWAVGGGGGGAQALCVLIADSSARTETTETAFNKTCVVAGNTFAVGDVVRISVSGLYTTTATGAMTVKMRIGGTAFFNVAVSVVNGVTNEVWTAQGDFTVRSIGASGAIEPGPNLTLGTSSYGLASPTTNPAGFTKDTTGSLTIDLTNTWNVSGESLYIKSMMIERIPTASTIS